MVKVTVTNNLDKIPDELRKLDQWVDCNNVKVPINPRIGSHASSTDPRTWSSYEKARDAVENGKYKHVGFVFTTNDSYIGIDLDKVRNPDTGEILPWAQSIIDLLDSYTEVSQSGTGIHIIIRGRKPGGRCRTGNVEIYDSGRYFALTGDLLDETHSTIEDRQEQLNSLYAETFGKDDDETLESEPEDDSDLRSIDEKFNELIDREIALETYERRRTDKGFPSDSEYDQAMANYARAAGFTYQEAIDLITTSWREHGLDKSDKREKKMSRKDYWERTIGKADAWVKKSKVKSPSIAERLVKIAQDWELFHTHDKTAYAVIKQENHSEVHSLGEHKCRLAKHFLSDAYHEKTGKIPNEQAIQSALTILRGTAILHNREEAVYKRIAGHEGKVYVDLCDPDWSVVEVYKRSIIRRGCIRRLVSCSPNEFEELPNINLDKELPRRSLCSVSVKSMGCSPLSRAGYRYESSQRDPQGTNSGSDWASKKAAIGLPAMPDWAAIIAAWVRLRACSLLITFPTCFLAVSKVMQRVPAIALFVSPFPMSLSTSTSLGVR